MLPRLPNSKMNSKGCPTRIAPRPTMLAQNWAEPPATIVNAAGNVVGELPGFVMTTSQMPRGWFVRSKVALRTVPSTEALTFVLCMVANPERESWTLEPEANPLPTIFTETCPVSPPVDGEMDRVVDVAVLHLPEFPAFAMACSS